MRWALVATLALAACVGPRVMRSEGAPTFAPTRPSDVRVLDAVPEGAIVLGTVDGVGTTGLMIGPEALANAIEGAASMGADAIVIEGRGSEPVPGDIFARDYQTVRVKAIRLAR